MMEDWEKPQFTTLSIRIPTDFYQMLVALTEGWTNRPPSQEAVDLEAAACLCAGIMRRPRKVKQFDPRKKHHD